MLGYEKKQFNLRPGSASGIYMNIIAYYRVFFINPFMFCLYLPYIVFRGSCEPCCSLGSQSTLNPALTDTGITLHLNAALTAHVYDCAYHRQT